MILRSLFERSKRMMNSSAPVQPCFQTDGSWRIDQSRVLCSVSASKTPTGLPSHANCLLSQFHRIVPSQTPSPRILLVSPRYLTSQYSPIPYAYTPPPSRSHSSFSQPVQRNNVHTYCSIHNAVSVAPALCTLAGSCIDTVRTSPFVLLPGMEDNLLGFRCYVSKGWP
ncbi:hypothetical protein HYPSUDRAFT_761269 [Hypholoma sublateritium FD-334 SS-4]|uniref:Uncharacterized protein n=1 Tax=Hypholoma sublateritium (strain FD-334 SS-4) TaxID=945553 RepID=A0A0D2MCE3_HYPSF|nr:hypothetical protein HYPSUDRAFT_761269 [Hypholoma sublateritium FD-334 SS-4]